MQKPSAYFNVAILVQKDVHGFEITMNDSL